MKFNVFQILALVALIGLRMHTSFAQEPTKEQDAPATREESSGEYEIDYEEEPESGGEVPESDDAEEAVAKKPTTKTPQKPAKRNAFGGGPAVQGTHSKNRFAPILKSETRSVYKKNGKPLDVDTD